MSNQGIMKFVTNKKGSRIGVLMAQKDKDGIVRFGWSRVNRKMGDKFDRERAIEIAQGRINSGRECFVCQSFEENMSYFYERATKFFKDSDGFQKVGVQVVS